MRAALLLLVLLLSVSVTAMAEPKENMPEEKKPEEDKETLGRLTPKKISDKGWQRGPLVEGPVAGGTTDITGSNDQHLAEVSQVGKC